MGIISGKSLKRVFLLWLICEACILKYDSQELGIDDVTETEETVDEL